METIAHFVIAFTNIKRIPRQLWFTVHQVLNFKIIYYFLRGRNYLTYSIFPTTSQKRFNWNIQQRKCIFLIYRQVNYIECLKMFLFSYDKSGLVFSLIFVQLKKYMLSKFVISLKKLFYFNGHIPRNLGYQ